MIVVVGSTGSTGLHTVRELAAMGHTVRATARDFDRARAAHAALGVDPSRVELASVDFERPETFAPALEGATRVYVAVGGPTGTPALVECECRFIDAAKRAGVRHYVKVSGIDARPDSPSKIQRMHGQIGAHLAASGVPHTILEPSFFMQNFLGLAPAIVHAGVLPLPTGDAKAGIIDARDIARVAASVLTSEGHLGQRYVLTGPELLSHEDAAAVLARVLERPVRFQDLPQAAFDKALCDAGLPPWFADLLADVYGQVFRPGLASRVTDDVRRVTGTAPRSLETFVRDHRAAFA